MTWRRATLPVLAAMVLAPALANAGPSTDRARDTATAMVTEICASALPDFATAIEMGLARGYSALDDENIVDSSTSVSLTVVPASKSLLVISVPPLCVVTMPAPAAAPYIPVAEAMATSIGEVTDRDGSTETLRDDGMSWTIARGDGSVDLQLLEDHSVFGDSVIFALVDFGEP